MATKIPTFKSTFTLGGVSAEADDLLDEAFVESSDFNVIASKDDKRCFIVGRTGSGKSAALKRLEDVQHDHVIRINPEDLSLPYITNLNAIKYLDGLEINLDPFWTTLWKHVLLVEILRHRYKIDSPTAKQNFIGNLKSRIKTDHAKLQALEYLDEYAGQFWCEADVRVREITDSFTKRIDAEAGAEAKMAGAGFRAGGNIGEEVSKQTHEEQIDRFQRIVNETQLARLNQMMKVLNEDILENRQHFTYVIIDDLDRDWVDERIANDLIRCLFRTVQDLKRVQNLKILVALRTNIFQELDFSRRGAGQEEKLRALVLEMKWTRRNLSNLLDERVAIACERSGLQEKTMSELLPHANKARGKPLDYLLDRTLLRPRDAITFANECFNVGVGKSQLTWVDIQAAEREYSIKLLLALRDEWKGTYPGIDRVFEKFRGSPIKMSRKELCHRLDDVMLLPADRDFPGSRWLTDVSTLMMNSYPGDDGFELYQPLLVVLFSTGLIGCATRDSAVPIFYFDDPNFIKRETNLEKITTFFIHRGYHAGLEVRSNSDFG